MHPCLLDFTMSAYCTRDCHLRFLEKAFGDTAIIGYELGEDGPAGEHPKYSVSSGYALHVTLKQWQTADVNAALLLLSSGCTVAAIACSRARVLEPRSKVRGTVVEAYAIDVL